jgi:imidazolonepropionase-like amidohydrolase
MATAGNAALLAHCGPRDPYPGGLGVVRAGAPADLLLVDGGPLADLGLLADPERNLAEIMKAGPPVPHTRSDPWPGSGDRHAASSAARVRPGRTRSA